MPAPYALHACLAAGLLGLLSQLPSEAQAAVSVDTLQYLFDRPTEPVFTAKEGDKSKRQCVFTVPTDYLTDRDQKLARESPEVIDRFSLKAGSGVEHVKLRPVDVDLSEPMELPRDGDFSLFIPEHRRKAARLIEILLEQPTVDDLVSVGVKARSLCNPYLFNYAFSVAIMHRDDTTRGHVPPLAKNFPHKYVPGGVINQARLEGNVVDDATKRVPLDIPRDYSASDLEEEHKMAYWREDLGINLHHWHWHLYFPANGPPNIIRKDRRGELFYYSHQQLVARYNFERFANGMQRVKRLIDFREPIVEGYFPKLDSAISSRNWPARAANMRMTDLNRETDGIIFDVADLERWRDRILEAIHAGSVLNLDGSRQNLTEKDGVDLLGHMIEATDLSPNKALYGDLHNFLHVILAYIHDPDGRHLERGAIMGDPAINLRDPVFYRVHSFVDDLFQVHKRKLNPYTVEELDFPGVAVTGIDVQTDTARRPNEFYTYWQQSDVDMSQGLDFTPRGAVYARFTHLQHVPFTYRIQVQKTAPGTKRGYVRIFMAPKYTERGRKLLFREQRLLMVEMDKFVVTLDKRNNAFERRSSQSSVTIPFGRTFSSTASPKNQTSPAAAEFNYCGCGLPQHLLIPKGTPQGMEVQLFVMITDFEKDEVKQPRTQGCVAGHSFCGLHNQKYPDKKPMGFPFDRESRPKAVTIEAFLTGNMKVEDKRIFFRDVIADPNDAASFKGLIFPSS